MKQISKKPLDEVIAITRQSWEASYEEGRDKWQKRIDLAVETVKEIGWSPLIDFLDGILSSNGFAPDATNDEIYSVLRILGWEVVDHEQEHLAE